MNKPVHAPVGQIMFPEGLIPGVQRFMDDFVKTDEDFQDFLDRSDKLGTAINEIEIKNDSDLQKGISLVEDVKKLLKQADEKRKIFAQPLTDVKKIVDVPFGKIRDMLKVVKATQEDKNTTYSRLRARRIQEAEEAARLKAKQREDELRLKEELKAKKKMEEAEALIRKAEEAESAKEAEILRLKAQQREEKAKLIATQAKTINVEADVPQKVETKFKTATGTATLKPVYKAEIIDVYKLLSFVIQHRLIHFLNGFNMVEINRYIKAQGFTSKDKFPGIVIREDYAQRSGR